MSGGGKSGFLDCLCVFWTHFLLFLFSYWPKVKRRSNVTQSQDQHHEQNVDNIHKLTVKFDVKINKNKSDILPSVQRKRSRSMRGRCTDPLEKTSWGLRTERTGLVRIRGYPPTPPHIPSLSPVNAATQVPLTSQEVDPRTGSAPDAAPWCWSRWQPIVVSSGGGGRTGRDVTGGHSWWTGSWKEKEAEEKKKKKERVPEAVGGYGVKLRKRGVKPDTWCMNMADLSLKADKRGQHTAAVGSCEAKATETSHWRRHVCPLNSPDYDLWAHRRGLAL